MKPLVRRFALFLILAFALPLQAAPGAHGPNGEHLDGPAAGSAAVSDGRPRMEAFTELFELVAHLEDDALTAMINVYETNAPVDGAEVELESDGVTAKAAFDPTTGVYRFADPALLEKLRAPGKHSLAFTITAGDEFDIVAGALDVADHDHDHASGGLRWWHVALGLLLLAVAAFLFLHRRSAGARASGARR